MSKKLFNSFDAVSAKQWKQKIQFDLKGADYNTTLNWHTNHDITVKPFYHADDFNALPNPSNTQATKWRICETIYVADEKTANKRAINALKKGAECIKFIIPSNSISIENLLNAINIDETPLYFECDFISESFIKNSYSKFKKTAIFQNDIIHNLAKIGNWYANLNTDFNTFKAIVSQTNSISIDTTLYQNAGANIVQQLAYALAHANEYLNVLTLPQNAVINFNVAIGSNYFFEIAKLKALRLLWQTLAHEYKTNTECHIFATPNKRNKTIYDYNTNMLRTTTECMSAILGGANTISNLAYDSVYNKTNAFGSRIARNQLLILKHESYFNKVNNPTDGAYYIENLTQQLAEKALELFKNIETNGGFLKQLKSGIIQRKIKESAAKETEQFNNGTLVLLGTNKHPNSLDKMKNNLELYPFVKTNKRKTLIEPVIERRLAETLEQNRLKTES
ncbi:methylmalonyl-CoA mutase [Seonamhaeicola algicola]|uniref:Methylmalonyl-CoA mutase n=1 Tax=Seonamhaeicola algicola TaxID=1719036 RepID=A0A5C7AMG5_9FLAO|nr:methylmalonyl-CoA mutase subunit beta [Seonamhaeicola algicola]TXE09930.1 methylmalonyl-CoA mutase [Seonamhaeicola algicola]